jgi:hypothetical protein
MSNLSNIGPRGVRARAVQGAVALAAAAVLFLLQALRGTPLIWTLSTAILLWLGGIGIFQARAKT